MHTRGSFYLRMIHDSWCSHLPLMHAAVVKNNATLRKVLYPNNSRYEGRYFFWGGEDSGMGVGMFCRCLCGVLKFGASKTMCDLTCEFGVIAQGKRCQYSRPTHKHLSNTGTQWRTLVEIWVFRVLQFTIQNIQSWICVSELWVSKQTPND